MAVFSLFSHIEHVKQMGERVRKYDDCFSLSDEPLPGTFLNPF